MKDRHLHFLELGSGPTGRTQGPRGEKEAHGGESTRAPQRVQEGRSRIFHRRAAAFALAPGPPSRSRNRARSASIAAR